MQEPPLTPGTINPPPALAEQFNELMGRVIPWWENNDALRLVALIISSIVIARLTDWILTSLLRRWVRKTTSDFDDKLLNILHRPIFVSVLVVGLWLTAHSFGSPDSVRFYTFAILASLAVLMWFFALMQVSNLAWQAAARSDAIRFVKRDTLPLFDNLSKVVLFGIATYLLIVTWQANITGWLASAGIAGIAIGFAARDTLANLFAGAFIFADAPYRVGDFVNLDSGERGEVTEIGLRSTRLQTRDDVEITIPNSVIASAKIINESGGTHPRYRLRIKVGVAYGSDLDEVRETLVEVAREHPLVSKYPEPRVRFRSFGDSSLDHELLCWVEKPVLRGRVIDALNTKVYKEFAKRGIEIPFPQRDVHMR